MKDNQKMSEPIILNTSDEAASIQTITGWVSREGFFYGPDERTARYAGATHMVCENCGGHYPKGSWCDPCQKTKDDAKYAAFPVQEWDGVTPLAIFDSDIYFFDYGDIERYCEDNDVTLDSLRLVLCEPMYVPRFELTEFCADVLPEDGDESHIDPAIVEAADVLDKAIRESKKAVSWWCGNIAVRISTNAPRE